MATSVIYSFVLSSVMDDIYGSSKLIGCSSKLAIYIYIRKYFDQSIFANYQHRINQLEIIFLLMIIGFRFGNVVVGVEGCIEGCVEGCVERGIEGGSTI